MKALVKAEARPGMWMKDIPEPTVGPNDVLIKIAKTAICGTDMHIYHWDAWAQKTIPVPMAVGHEYFGRIVEMGSEVRGFAIGDRVSGEGHITCGFCRNCRAGRRHLCRNTVGVGVDRQGCRPATRSNYRTRSPTTSRASSTRSAMPRTPPSPSRWSARTC
jgi:threonine 3-dehydrogenase